MIITLEELNKCVKALPDPHIAQEMQRAHWRVAIELDMPVRPLYEEPSPTGPVIRFATFELKHMCEGDRTFWRWAPSDEVII